MSVFQRLIRRPGAARKSPGGTATASPEETTRQILMVMVGDRPLRNVSFRLWDGSTWPDDQPRPAKVVLNRPSALREMLLPGTETAVGEAYLNNAFDVEGSMEAAFELADHLMDVSHGWTRTLGLGFLLHRLPTETAAAQAARRARLRGQRHSLDRDQEAIHFHYNVSNDFYALWLGRQMAYSCAYFHAPTDDLETAQDNKLDLICRKLGLHAGQRFLDIGCGWGGLVLHAAQHYGVLAEGITLSEEQLKLARERIAQAGLEDRVSVRLQDYRKMPEEACFDAVASVGMVEHVGREQLGGYFRKVHALLKPGGLFLNHGIDLGPVIFPGTSGSFIQDYVFPDSDLVPIGDMLRSAEAQGWEIRDVDGLREHYALTLRAWLARLEAHHEEALRFVDEPTYRIWRLYMAGCAHNFQTGRLTIYQTLLAKLNAGGVSRAPAVRSVWYA